MKNGHSCSSRNPYPIRYLVIGSLENGSELAVHLLEANVSISPSAHMRVAPSNSFGRGYNVRSFNKRQPQFKIKGLMV